MKLTASFHVWRRPKADAAPDMSICWPGEAKVSEPLPLDDLIASYIAGFYRAGWSIEDLARELEVSIITVRRYLSLANDLIPAHEHMEAHEAGQLRRGPLRRLTLGGVRPPEARHD